MTAWIFYGGAPPAWMDDLMIARDWHCKPWEVEDAPLAWYERTRHTLIMEQAKEKETWQPKQ